MKPSPTPEQALHTLEILGRWTACGWDYRCLVHTDDTGGSMARRHRAIGSRLVVRYTDPEDPSEYLESFGVNHFDALAQATSVMQILLEEHPEKPHGTD